MIDVAGRGNASIPMIWYGLGVNPKTNCDDGSSSTRLTVATMLASVCILSRRGALAVVVAAAAVVVVFVVAVVVVVVERVMLATAPT